MVSLSGSTAFPQWPTDIISLDEINSYLTYKGITLDEPVDVYFSTTQVLRLIMDNV